MYSKEGTQPSYDLCLVRHTHANTEPITHLLECADRDKYKHKSTQNSTHTRTFLSALIDTWKSGAVAEL